jgi:hypothetical protein
MKCKTELIPHEYNKETRSHFCYNSATQSGEDEEE